MDPRSNGTNSCSTENISISIDETCADSKDGEWLEFLRKGIRDTNLYIEPSSIETRQVEKKVKPTAQNEVKKTPFEPIGKPPPRLPLPDDLWLSVLGCLCAFPPESFNKVMLNLIKNPNITSSHLFRADIFYDSEIDHLFDPTSSKPYEHLTKCLKQEYQPLPATKDWPDFQLQRTIVRELIPRNPKLDRKLAQTCHFFTRTYTNPTTSDGQAKGENATTQTLVLYIPHESNPSKIPFYHPTVSQLAFLHTHTHSPSSYCTILYRPFPVHPLTPKHTRTALSLLSTLHRHGHGTLTGYSKRVNLDVLIPQKTYQDTYTHLKGLYAKRLTEQWAEVTDPGKHVFEDLGIAAYLIELWRGMYGEGVKTLAEGFPGFVDIGCGNGVLVYVLGREGYEGWGFDARERKSWEGFAEARLERRVLVPKVLQDAVRVERRRDEWHDGVFRKGTFIVSNHADELTPWTPLLAYLNESAFIAIPCCSHDLAGGRFRAPSTTKGERVTKGGKEKAAEEEASARLPQQVVMNGNGSTQAAETGSLKRTEAQKKMPSAYASLCSYVTSLATEVGFEPETDVLRIPSTRNSCIVGRNRTSKIDRKANKSKIVVELIQRELKRDMSTVGADWIERAEKLTKKPSSGH